MTSIQKHKELGKKIQKGMMLAHKRMVKDKIKNDLYVIVSINGKNVRKKAKEIYADVYPDLVK
jgi:hypothetical protein